MTTIEDTCKEKGPKKSFKDYAITTSAITGLGVVVYGASVYLTGNVDTSLVYFGLGSLMILPKMR